MRYIVCLDYNVKLSPGRCRPIYNTTDDAVIASNFNGSSIPALAVSHRVIENGKYHIVDIQE